MSKHFQRRDFLKLLALLPSLKLPWSWFPDLPTEKASSQSDQNPPNVIVMVFDALSATNMSLYGYHRNTTPNLDRLAKRAIVYHQHYAGGSFTTPGTASLLTGLYPWTHRAFHIYGTVDKRYEQKNIFQAFSEISYDTVAYSHNDLALALLHQFSNGLNTLKKTQELSLLYDNVFSDRLFINDHNAAFLGERVVTRGQRGQTNQYPSGIFFAMLHKIWRTHKQSDIWHTYKELFPRGMPSANDAPIMYLLEDAVDWVIQRMASSPPPSLGYYHFFPPHEPYNTRQDFIDVFIDGWAPNEKTEHHFTQGHHQNHLNLQRRFYDEFILYADAEFGRFMDQMEERGFLDNTIVVFTSDHGEMFERGILEHVSPTLFDPLVRIPLVIFMPRQGERVDVKSPTSCVDVLPTLLHATGYPTPSWSEGQVLAPFNGMDIVEDRSIYTMDAKENYKNADLGIGTVGMIKGRYKLVYYFGYEDFDKEYELFDLENDPEEIENIYASSPMSKTLKDELQEKLRETNHLHSVNR
jgi:arylsulfatase A-like enzyme